MDKSWMKKPRNSIEYVEGVRGFIDFAFQHSSIEGKILCPCSPCGFRKWMSKETVYDHLLCKKFPEGYTFWFYHGESKVASTSNVGGGAHSYGVQDQNVDADPMFNMINDAFGKNAQHDNDGQFQSNKNNAEDEGTTQNAATEEVSADKEFYEVARDGELPLYEGCVKYSKLSFIVKLYHIKCLCGMTDKSMTMILELLKDAFEHANIPASFYEAKKIITKLGLDYKNIHACPKNCMLYWGEEDESRQSCKVCHTSRWKPPVKEVSDGTSSQQGKKMFLSTLRNISVPDGYASNISRCIDVDSMRMNEMLKSHDCHILIEQLLPLATRITLPDNVSRILIELCSFFKQLSDNVLNVANLDKLQREVVLTLCHMEMLFPPSFFTVMVHLIVHLVEEAKLGGPVQYRWMYPIERYLGQLKSYVRNRARPEGCIAQGYIMQEVLTFCSKYLDNIETRWNRPGRVDDGPRNAQAKSRMDELFPRVGKPVGASSYFNLTSMERLQAHRHVLTNCPLVECYVQEFRRDLKRQLRRIKRSQAEIDKRVHREFVDWLSKRIPLDIDNISESDKGIMFSLAKGPFYQARRFSAYNVNRFKFRTLHRDKNLKTQNCGVFGTFDTRSYSSSRDGQMICGGVPYYGKLVDIVEINYNGLFIVPLFKCQWTDTTTLRGHKKDKLGFTQINFSKLIHIGDKEDDEPYIKASESQMVFYVDDEKEKGWSIPVHVKPRDWYDMGEDIMTTTELFLSQNLDQILDDDTIALQLSRPATDDDTPHLIANQNEDEAMDI